MITREQIIYAFRTFKKEFPDYKGNLVMKAGELKDKKAYKLWTDIVVALVVAEYKLK